MCVSCWYDMKGQYSGHDRSSASLISWYFEVVFSLSLGTVPVCAFLRLGALSAQINIIISANVGSKSRRPQSCYLVGVVSPFSFEFNINISFCVLPMLSPRSPSSGTLTFRFLYCIASRVSLQQLRQYRITCVGASPPASGPSTSLRLFLSWT